MNNTRKVKIIYVFNAERSLAPDPISMGLHRVSRAFVSPSLLSRSLLCLARRFKRRLRLERTNTPNHSANKTKHYDAEVLE